MLFHEGHALRQSFAGHAKHVLPVQQHFALMRFAKAGEQAKQ